MNFNIDFGTGEITYLWLRQRGFHIEYPAHGGPDLHMAIKLPQRQHDNYLELVPLNNQKWMAFFRNDDARRRWRFVFLRDVAKKTEVELLYFALADAELPQEVEFDRERKEKLRDTFMQMGAEAQKHWADYCNSGFKKDVIWLEH